MSSLRIVLSRVSALFRRGRLEADLEDDVRAHLDLLTAEYERRGVPAREARLAARRDFGGVQQMKERYRDSTGLRWFDDVRHDVRFAMRMLGRNRSFAAVAIATLALGIGANTALFSVVDALMLRKLPVDDPDALVVFASKEGPGAPDYAFSYPLYIEFRAAAREFAGIAASSGAVRHRLTVRDLDEESDPESVNVESVTGNFFSVLGMRPYLGRALVHDDDRPDAPGAVVLSHAFWTRRFGRDASVVGRAVTIDGVPLTVVGVAPPGFFGFEVGSSPDGWWPLQRLLDLDRTSQASTLSQRTSEWLSIVGRLRSAEGRAPALARMQTIYQRDVEETFRRRAGRRDGAMTPAQRAAFFDRSLELQSGATGGTELRQQYGRSVVILTIVVGVVLLIACANVANLLLARAAARQREISVRIAIGAGRSRVVRQLVTESVSLAVLGGAFGLFVAVWVTRLLLAFVPDPEVTLHAAIDLRVLTFAAGVSVLTGVLFGVMPALSITRRDTAAAFANRTGAVGSPRRTMAQNTLVVTQVALSVVILVACGLFLRTLQNLRQLDLGFDADNLTVFRLALPGRYDAAMRASVYRNVVERLEELPEVQAVSFSLFGLLSNMNRNVAAEIPGFVARPGEPVGIRQSIVGPRFFEVTGTRILRGRGFTRDDETSARRVAVIDETMAGRFSGDPLGQRFAPRGPSGPEGEPFEVVGIAENAKYRNLREADLPTFYASFGREASAVTDTSRSAAVPRVPALIEIRTATNGAIQERVVQRVVRDTDPAAIVTNVQSMRGVVAAAMSQERLLSFLGGLFGVLALAVAAVGIYGVRSFAVSNRTNEIGIRIALGATGGQMLRSVLYHGIGLAAIGIALGTVAALLLTRYVAGLLYEVPPYDPATFGAVALTFGAVALLASYLPARRATRVDPLTALRAE